MPTLEIVVTIDSDVLEAVDALVNKRMFPNRSRVIQDAVKEKLERLSHDLLAQECAKLDPEYEKASGR